MGAIFLPQRDWWRQPQGFNGFNSRYPKPGFCYLPSAMSNTDLVRGLAGTPGAGEIRRATVKGISYNSIRQTNGGLNFGSARAINAETFSILQVANPASAAAYTNMFSQRTNGTSSHIAGYWNTDASLSIATGKFAALVHDGSGNQSFAGTTGTVVDGAFHVWGVTRNGTTNAPVVWVDGNKPAQTSTTVTLSAVDSASKTRIGNPADYTADGTLASTADHALVVCWDSVLPDGLMAVLGRNPWQLFAPLPSRVYSFSTQSIVPVLYHHYASQRAA